MNCDEKYMRRAIQLAKSSMEDTHPNPNVGAVIVADGRIIGEGYHRRCGQPHAEVNAVNSVSAADRHLLREATIYVTLEPCSHYGKTPPCSKLIIDSGIPRVVIACGDPFEKVRGRGVAMLRAAGVEVVEGVLEEEAWALNPRFFTAHTLGRPYITLKWAQSADGYMDARRDTPDATPFQFSTPLDATMVHRQRALHDAILTTASTLLADNPRLDVRNWDGPAPAIAIIDRKGLIDTATATRLRLFTNPTRRILLFTPQSGLSEVKEKAATTASTPQSGLSKVKAPAAPTTSTKQSGLSEVIPITPATGLPEIMSILYSKGITSLLTECGPRMLRALIDANLYDAVRVFTSPAPLGPDRGASPAPAIPASSTITSHQ